MQEVLINRGAASLEVVLSGIIDSENSDEFYAEVTAAYAPAPCDIVFECSALEFIDSTTLGTFVKILKHVREGGHGMKLVHTQPRLKKLFVICALDTIMEIE